MLLTYSQPWSAVRNKPSAVFLESILVFRVVSFQEVMSEGNLGSYFCFEFQDCVKFQGKLLLLSLGKGVQIQRFIVSGCLLIPTGLQPLLAFRVTGRFSFPFCLQQDASRHWDLVFHCIPTLVSYQSYN